MIRGLPNNEPSRFIMSTIVTAEPDGPIGLPDMQAPNWRRMSMSVLAGLASSAATTVATMNAARAAPLGQGVRARPPIGSAENRLAPLQAFRRPELFGIVVRLESRNVRGQRDPGQLGAGVDMDVRRERRRIVERSHAHEGERQDPAIVTEDRGSAGTDPCRPPLSLEV